MKSNDDKFKYKNIESQFVDGFEDGDQNKFDLFLEGVTLARSIGPFKKGEKVQELSILYDFNELVIVDKDIEYTFNFKSSIVPSSIRTVKY